MHEEAARQRLAVVVSMTGGDAGRGVQVRQAEAGDQQDSREYGQHGRGRDRLQAELAPGQPHHRRSSAAKKLGVLK